ncbi:Membrane-associated tyrosine- and threonine-specific cdc2-inhibitory kinase [Orchesella cincta]|uniref:non-specific serine/threonine protein kinase n=1 Tax=Orchesella cincta TaxID=48709 RepID=A0A1D2N530_ORCCI|nr:Membrane-associated tyrosine- and threonine-specific cdc2-inhibitory kinase [Orchesella cincta]
MSRSFTEESDFRNTSTGVQLPRFFPEPQTLSSKKDREKRSQLYIPPAPRPQYVRSAPAQTRLIHSRNDSHDLDNSFHYLMSSINSGNANSSCSILKHAFEIQERLGFGSFGDVFRVKGKKDNKEYAIKKSRRMYSGEGDRTRQLREVLRVTRIPPSLHLVALISAWEEEGHLFLQMELCSKSLTQEIEDGHYLTEDETWDLFIDMLFALQHLHTHHLVHMDLKPDNIFLTIDTPTIYKLGDFGIVVSLDEQKDELMEGDSRYLAPEVMQSKVSTKADVFSLGLTLLEVACSVDLPKGGELWHSLRNGGSLPDPCPRSMPVSLQHIVKLMITPDVNHRPEVSDLLSIPAVRARVRRRQLRLRMASLKKTLLQLASRMWHSCLAFLTSLWFFKSKKSDIVADQSRGTPEPMPMESDVPCILLNDTSFSDDDEMRGGGTPAYASTPIPHSKTKSEGRLRSSRRKAGDGDFRTLGSPTSRNLLKEFEAVSD